MRSIIILPKSDRGFFKTFFAIFSDPFYYLMNLNSLLLLMLVGAVIVSLLASIMMGIWIFIKLVTMGIVHSPSDAPVKMFLAMSVITIFTTFAGFIHRHLTRAEIRGRFISFSQFISLRKGEELIFHVVDKRATQLIGMSLCAEVVIDHGHGEFEFRRIPIESPGILALPTEVAVQLRGIFPEILHANCTVCGAKCSTETIAAHLNYYHEIDQRGAVENRRIKMHMLIGSIHSIRIRISGVDEVSGKPGTAEHVYEKPDIIIDENKTLIDDFDIVTTTLDDVSSGRTISSLSGDSSPRKKFVHVDFNYQ